MIYVKLVWGNKGDKSLRYRFTVVTSRASGIIATIEIERPLPADSRHRSMVEFSVYSVNADSSATAIPGRLRSVAGKPES